MTMNAQLKPWREYAATHFRWQTDADGKVATITLDRPEKKNPLTFESYAELRDLFRGLGQASDVKVIVITGAGGNFSSGGDVHEIIGPLTRMRMPELLAFTRMTGDLVEAMRHCPQPIVAAVDGICAGAGAMVALASDLRFGTPQAKTAFLFTRVGLAGCDMGACTLLPRTIGQGRAAELLYTGRVMTADRRRRVGLFQPDRRAGGSPHRGTGARAGARRRADVRPRHDQDAAASGMGDGSRRRDRGRGRGAGDLHADRRLPPRVRGVRRQAVASIRGQLSQRPRAPNEQRSPRLAVFRRRASHARGGRRALGSRRRARSRARRPRRRLPRPRSRPRGSRLASLLRACRPWWRAARARFARAVPRPRDAGAP